MDFDSNDSGSPPSVSNAFPPPPKVPTFASRSVSMRAARRSLTLVANNPTPAQTSVTVPALRLVAQTPKVEVLETVPPPSIPPTGSTPIRRAA